MDVTSKPFISPNSNNNDQPRKVNLTPLSMNNSGTLRKENLVCPHAGVHQTCLTINGVERRRERLLTPSYQEVDGAVTNHAASVDTSKSPRTAPTVLEMPVWKLCLLTLTLLSFGSL